MRQFLRILLTASFVLSANSVFQAPALANTFSLTIGVDAPQGYDRSLFKHWIDADRDGCNTRNEVLIEEATKKPKIGSNCRLSGGRWTSPFDGKKHTNPSKLDIDHVVPLAEAWRSGAWRWSPAERESFANDLDEPRALVAVTLNLNRSKGDRDVSAWLPPKGKCDYVLAWVTVKAKYQLTVDSKESTTLDQLSKECSIEINFIRDNENSQVAPLPSSSPSTVSPSPSPSKSSQTNSNTQSLPLISPGAFCSQSQAGQTGQNSKGVIYTCKTSDSENRLRWRQ